jgi:hypothetical protein
VNTIIQCDPELLRPIVQAVVTEALARLEMDRAKLTAKIAFTEAEAARLLSLRQHQLRDERRRGRVKCSHGPGKMILYQPAHLIEYLMSRPYTPPPNGRNEGPL